MKKLVGVMVSLLIATAGYAHFLWLNVDNYNPQPGEEITITIGWGHKFPQDGEPKLEILDKLYLIDPDGKTIPLELKAKDEKGVEPVKVKLEKRGTYLAVLTKKFGFVSKTTKGYKYKSKRELEGVLRSYWSEGSAFAIINVGAPKGNSYKKEIGLNFQVMALKNPGELKKGMDLPIKVICKNRPEGFHANFVYATYAGFSDTKDTYCYATRPDKEGIAKIKLLERGVWLIYAQEKFPYPNPEEADEYSLTSTLTFEVK